MSKGIFKTAGINIFTFLVLAFIVEGVLSLTLNNPSFIPEFLLEPFRDYYRISDRNIIQVTECAEYDSDLFYILKQGSCSFENREFKVENQINSQGLRDDETSLQFPSIIALGDSYTMGWGVEQNESFPQVLEKRLHRKVLNAGISSFGTAREFELWNRLLTDSVKYIFLQYHANDYEENEKFVSNNFGLRIRNKFSYDSLCKAISNRERYFPFKHLYGVSKGIAKGWLKSQPTIPGSDDEAQHFLRVIKNSGLRPEIRIIVFKLDENNYKNQNNCDDFVKRIDSLLKTDEFSSLNISTIKLGNSLTREDYFILDDHINAKGHLKIATKIHQQIDSLSP
jgi:hypothetical protein